MSYYPEEKRNRLAAVHPTSETSNNIETLCLVYPDALLTRNLQVSKGKGLKSFVVIFSGIRNNVLLYNKTMFAIKTDLHKASK